MPNHQLTPHADLYTKAFEDCVKEPIEYLQFLTWIKELIRVTDSQNRSFDLLYIDLFYIRIFGLFDIVNKENSVSVCNDSYTRHVKKCVAEMYTVLTDDEYINLMYYRHCAAHPLQNYYDLFDAKGHKKEEKSTIKIRGKEKILSVEDIDKTLHSLFCHNYNNGTSFDRVILLKLTPFIEKLRKGWDERMDAQIASLGMSKDSELYKTIKAF
ncbi:MAG: hypothetical protein IJT12_04030 [Paludibacteraceae bacterium]|nr:hypothetical protein [Paludibacteraceae bacterium]